MVFKKKLFPPLLYFRKKKYFNETTESKNILSIGTTEVVYYNSL